MVSRNVGFSKGTNFCTNKMFYFDGFIKNHGVAVILLVLQRHHLYNHGCPWLTTRPSKLKCLLGFLSSVGNVCKPCNKFLCGVICGYFILTDTINNPAKKPNFLQRLLTAQILSFYFFNEVHMKLTDTAIKAIKGNGSKQSYADGGGLTNSPLKVQSCEDCATTDLINLYANKTICLLNPNH